jgi:hypothetical protein
MEPVGHFERRTAIYERLVAASAEQRRKQLLALRLEPMAV